MNPSFIYYGLAALNLLVTGLWAYFSAKMEKRLAELKDSILSAIQDRYMDRELALEKLKGLEASIEALRENVRLRFDGFK